MMMAQAGQGPPPIMSANMAFPPMPMHLPLPVRQNIVKSDSQSTSPWTEHKAPDGRTYFYHEGTKQSSWEKPEELKTPAEKLLSTCEWKEYKTDEGKVYYHHVATNESSWTVPAELQELRSKVLAEQGVGVKVEPGLAALPLSQPVTPALPTLQVAEPIIISPNDSASNISYDDNSRSNTILTATPSLSATVGSASQQHTPDIESPKESDPKSKVVQSKDLFEVFRELLREKNVSSNASWEYALKLISSDSRYELFRHHPERKQMFNAYKTQKAKEEKEEQRLKVKRSKENLEKFLQTNDKMTSNTRYRQALELFRDADAWKGVPDQDRREIFRDVSEHLAVKEKEETKAQRKRNMKVLSDILDAMTSITFRTTWQEAQQLLLDNSIFAEDAELLGMDKEDALIVFEDHIRQLEKEEEEEKKREKVRVYRQQRKNRESFIFFLDQLHAQGKLTSISKWKQLYPELSADSRFTAMLSQPLAGSTPLDLFKFYVEDLKARYEDEKQTIRDILKKKNFDVTVDTTYEAFADVLSEDDRSAKLDAGNVKMVFERALEKVQEKEKERMKEETRKRKKLESAFLHILHDVEPAIDDKTIWDQVRHIVSSDEAFKAIETEPERVALFHTYQETLQESCSHHHSKSRKKKDKNKKDLKSSSRRRSRSSSRSSYEKGYSRSGRRRSRSPSKNAKTRRSRSSSSSRSRSRSKSRDVLVKSKHSKSRSYSRSITPRRSPASRSGSSERTRRARERPKSPVS